MRAIAFLVAAALALTACTTARGASARANPPLSRAEAAALVSAELERRVVYVGLPEGRVCFALGDDVQLTFLLIVVDDTSLITGVNDGRGRLFSQLSDAERAEYGCQRTSDQYLEVATIALTEKGRAEAAAWWTPAALPDRRINGRPTALWKLPFAGQRIKSVSAVLPRGQSEADIVFTWEWVQLGESDVALSMFNFNFIPLSLNATEAGQPVRRPREVENPFGMRSAVSSQVARAERTATGWRVTRIDLPEVDPSLTLEVLPAGRAFVTAASCAPLRPASREKLQSADEHRLHDKGTKATKQHESHEGFDLGERRSASTRSTPT